MYYTRALVGIENNYSTYPTRELERLNYPNLYVRESVDSYTNKLKKSHGFLTDSRTRPVMIAELQKLMREAPECVVDKETLSEMLCFVYNEQRRPEAMAGEHDDLVMGLAIAHQIRGQQRCTLEAPEPEKEEDGMQAYDDYMTGGEASGSYLGF